MYLSTNFKPHQCPLRRFVVGNMNTCPVCRNVSQIFRIALDAGVVCKFIRPVAIKELWSIWIIAKYFLTAAVTFYIYIFNRYDIEKD